MKIEKEHKEKTLMSYTKKQLVELVMCLETNNNALHETIEQQAKNCIKLLNRKWIPCSERMPEEHEEKQEIFDFRTHAQTDTYYYKESDAVLVTFKDTDTGEMFVSEDYTEDGKWHENVCFCEAIAWMPLPEPYKEEV